MNSFLLVFLRREHRVSTRIKKIINMNKKSTSTLLALLLMLVSQLFAQQKTFGY